VSLYLKITNDNTGTELSGNYDVQVEINNAPICRGRVEGFERQLGWRELVRRFVDSDGYVAGVPPPPQPPEPKGWYCACGWPNGINLATCAQCGRSPGFDNPCTVFPEADTQEREAPDLKMPNDWTLRDGRVIRLLTLPELRALPDGTQVIAINGELLTKGTDVLDEDTRGPWTAFGLAASTPRPGADQ
jgi:hypothetical protein